jgi:penicillin-binding protein 1C
MKHSCFSIILLLLVTASGYAMPSYQDVRSHYRSSDAVLLDRHGEVIQELRVDPYARRLAWTKLADISPALVAAVIRSEDKRFYRHHGVDWKAAVSAALGNLCGNGRRGASTITMQLAAMIDNGLRPGAGRRSLSQKWKQMRAAERLDGTWTKNEILETYLNLVSFRGELQGIAAASRGLFEKAPGGLDEAESAVLASLIRSPNAPAERVAERSAQLAVSLGSAIPPGRIAALALDRLSAPYTVWKRTDLAPHVARMLVRGGARSVRSTLDAGIQRFAVGVLAQAVGGLSGQNVRDGAVLVADNATGEVLAYVGNSGGWSSAPFVDGIRARRQAGSTLKPFLYGLAIEERMLTAASLIEDEPLELPTGRGLYRPANYDHEFRGDVTVRNALASSMNIPAVKTLGLVGADAFVKKMEAFGFTGLAEPEHYGPSLALGSADITLWDLVNAYRTLANGGVWSRLRLSPGEKPGPYRRALSRGASFIVADILSDSEARSSTFSLESALATRFWTAVKTGTSKDMRDNWCVGFSDRYSVGVWVGNFSGAPMWDVSGVSGAAPV